MAAIKVEELVKLLSEIGTVRIVATEAARHFFDASHVPAEVGVFGDEAEWRAWSKKGDPVLHIELRKWADVLVVAPLSANTLAKLATGLCDNLLVRWASFIRLARLHSRGNVDERGEGVGVLRRGPQVRPPVPSPPFACVARR